MNVFLIFVGIVLGVVFSVATFPGAIWSVQMTMKRGWMTGMAAGLGIASAQVIWAAVASGLLFMTARYSFELDWLYRICAAAVLFYMSITAVGANRVVSLEYTGPLKGILRVYWHSFSLAVSMPMRFFGYLSYFIAVSLHLFPHFRKYGVIDTLLLGFGVGIGSMLWWAYLATLTALFRERVPEPVSIRSLNKLRRLAGLIYLLLMLMCIVPLAPGFR